MRRGEHGERTWWGDPQPRTCGIKRVVAPMGGCWNAHEEEGRAEHPPPWGDTTTLHHTPLASIPPPPEITTRPNTTLSLGETTPPTQPINHS